MTNIKIKSIIKSQNKILKKKKREKETQKKITQISVKTLVNLHQKLEFSNH